MSNSLVSLELINSSIDTVLSLFHDNEVKWCEKVNEKGEVFVCKSLFPNASGTPKPTVAIDFEKDPYTVRKRENNEEPIFDTDSILGDYNYNASEKLITLYAKSISSAAAYLSVNANVLADVVLLHELGHWSSHVVKDKDGKMWENFDAADTKIKEAWAQILAYWAMKCISDSDYGKKLVDVFRTLEKKQSKVYKLDETANNIIDAVDVKNGDIKRVYLINALVQNRRMEYDFTNIEIELNYAVITHPNKDTPQETQQQKVDLMRL